MANTLYDLARDAYVLGDFEKAKTLLDSVVSDSELKDDHSAALFLRASGFEHGVFAGGVNYSAAASDYRAILAGAERAPRDVLLRYARVLYASDRVTNAEEILRVCEVAIFLYRDAETMMLAGRTKDEVLQEGAAARRLFVRAFFRGDPLGLDCVCRSFLRERKPFAAVLVAVIAFPLRPLVRFLGGRHRQPVAD